MELQIDRTLSVNGIGCIQTKQRPEPVYMFVINQFRSIAMNSEIELWTLVIIKAIVKV